MNVHVFFGLSACLDLIAWGLVAKLYVWPALRALPRKSANPARQAASQELSVGAAQFHRARRLWRSRRDPAGVGDDHRADLPMGVRDRARVALKHLGDH